MCQVGDDFVPCHGLKIKAHNSTGAFKDDDIMCFERETGEIKKGLGSGWKGAKIHICNGS